MVCINYSVSMNIIFITLCISFSSCANILGMFYFGGRSHHILGEVLLKELARRGHNVTMVSPFPLKERMANYTDIYLTGILEDQKKREQLFLKMNTDMLAGLEMFNVTLTQIELTHGNKDVQKLITSGATFDLIIMDWFFSYSLLIYADIFDVPVVGICSSGTIMAADITGNPSPPSFVPAMWPFPNNMTFLQRTENTMLHLTFNIMEYVNIGYHESILQKYFPQSPVYDKLKDRVALILANSHISFESPRPLVPTIIPVGGFHVERPKDLPKDLKKIIEESKYGVIYFSLGSILQSKILPEYKQQQIINAFAKVKQTVLWKWEAENNPDFPHNVIVRKWFPQNDILAHPNVKLFISHGGLLSTIEAIHHAKPVIGIPMFGDQQSNIVRAVRAGYGLKIEYQELTEESLLSAITEIINNPQYAENVQKRSDLLKDQLVDPMDRAVFWVEHVIKHKGASHLKHTGIYLRWYQYLLLDVTAFIITVIIVILVISYLCIRKIYCLMKYLLLRKTKKE